ncbi:hypothetical protein FOMPIDRAFT_1060756 [Fomitopsis schrenkii]|uniref:Uncharacterized protein n=1 Tax=Fomitopsis schrenkii TaxID=2126942 RepID=S8E3Z4_FOMSC|nr:hypothetical protein FOMPIDRAFT_1060756 [Fomitopsis schrenkii]
MSVVSITLVLGYFGRRLHQLRIRPIRRDSRFYPVSDYLLDDLRALRISTPDFVDVSCDCLRVKYTWAASTDPCRSTDTTRRIRAEVERASQERWLLSKLELSHIGIIERSSETDTPSKSWNVTAVSERAQHHGKRARSPSPEPSHQPKRPRITNHDPQRGACGAHPAVKNLDGPCGSFAFICFPQGSRVRKV